MSTTRAVWIFLLVLTVLRLALLGATQLSPDEAFYWVAAFYTFWLALERTPGFSWAWTLTGLLVGLGFLCKFTNAVELISILLVLLLVGRLRREFRRPNLYLLLLVFALCTIPPII